MMTLVTALTACSTLATSPKNKVIEYDEQVKLYDGSLFWVHIKRHYALASGALGDAGALEHSYVPTQVEVSWDTGFENIGRQTVFFNNAEHAFEYIDKQNSVWYIYGAVRACASPKDGIYDVITGQCVEGKGQFIQHSAYLYALDQQGFVKKSLDDLSTHSNFNVMDTRGLLNISTPPFELDGKTLSWQQKLQMKSTQKTFGQFFGKSVKNN
ncbi:MULTISPECIES: hypothetical protein [unclassified Acinetobacter]|uniref:hypothetical protein n=1 Tax=unclassified Acinetobacter TaxID=196816 RepID=UPI0035B912DF